jgi:hypothetical protein
MCRERKRRVAVVGVRNNLKIKELLNKALEICDMVIGKCNLGYILMGQHHITNEREKKMRSTVAKKSDESQKYGNFGHNHLKKTCKRYIPETRAL